MEFNDGFLVLFVYVFAYILSARVALAKSGKTSYSFWGFGGSIGVIRLLFDGSRPADDDDGAFVFWLMAARLLFLAGPLVTVAVITAALVW